MRSVRPRSACVALVALVALLGAAVPRTASADEPAAKKGLDLDAIYSPDSEKRVDLGGSPRTAFAWVDDGTYLLAVPAKDGGGALEVDARSGRSTPLYDAKKLEAAFARLPGFGAEDAAAIAGGCVDVGADDPYALLGCEVVLTLSPDRRAVLAERAGDLFYYRLGADAAVRLTAGPEAEEVATFSPDGRMVAFVRGGDLYVVGVDGGRERALTADGGGKILNGLLDWLYQEEIYGRGDFQAYRWSPDSRRIAFLRLDETPVPQYTVVDHIPVHPDLEVTPYPKAGDPNPIVEVGVVAAAGGEPVWLDLARYRPSDPLVVGIGWTPDSTRVAFQVQDREQTWLDFDLGDPGSGTVTTLFHESAAFIEAGRGVEPTWLADGSFLWPSMRSGWTHLYHSAAGGDLLAEVTPGEWEIDRVLGVDEGHGAVWFTSNRDEAPGRQLYRIGLDGTGLVRVSQRPGTHKPLFSPGFALYLDAWNDVSTPTQVRLHAADGAEVRVVDANAGAKLGDYRLGSVEFLQVPARDGYPMEAMVVKPPDFDPARRYPVLIYQYGGPHAPVVRNSWEPFDLPWHHLLAERGYVVWRCDNRSASAKGWLGTFAAHRRMGVIELQDTEDGVAWLRAQSWVDPDRVGLAGWSYGGFMTAYAMTHSTSFKAGIAGAPVTDWRLYDTVYTERVMGMPQKNPEGYDETSVLKAAGDLHGRLLLIHGTIDDNVHLQNSIKLIYELEKAGKQFDLALYPKSRHGPRDRQLVYHLRTLMTEFLEKNL